MVRMEFFAFDTLRLFYVNVEMPPDAPIERTMDKVLEIEQVVRRHVRPGEVRAMTSYAGNMFTEKEPRLGDNYGQILAGLNPRDPAAARRRGDDRSPCARRSPPYPARRSVSFLRLWPADHPAAKPLQYQGAQATATRRSAPPPTPSTRHPARASPASPTSRTIRGPRAARSWCCGSGRRRASTAPASIPAAVNRTLAPAGRRRDRRRPCATRGRGGARSGCAPARGLAHRPGPACSILPPADPAGRRARRRSAQLLQQERGGGPRQHPPLQFPPRHHRGGGPRRRVALDTLTANRSRAGAVGEQAAGQDLPAHLDLDLAGELDDIHESHGARIGATLRAVALASCT